MIVRVTLDLDLVVQEFLRQNFVYFIPRKMKPPALQERLKPRDKIGFAECHVVPFRDPSITEVETDRQNRNKGEVRLDFVKKCLSQARDIYEEFCGIPRTLSWHRARLSLCAQRHLDMVSSVEGAEDSERQNDALLSKLTARRELSATHTAEYSCFWPILAPIKIAISSVHVRFYANRPGQSEYEAYSWSPRAYC